MVVMAAAWQRGRPSCAMQSLIVINYPQGHFSFLNPAQWSTQSQRGVIWGPVACCGCSCTRPSRLHWSTSWVCQGFNSFSKTTSDIGPCGMAVESAFVPSTCRKRRQLQERKCSARTDDVIQSQFSAFPVFESQLCAVPKA